MTRRKTDDAIIRRMFDEGKTTAEIARHFNVTPGAIILRYKAIGIDVSGRRRPAVYSVNERFFDEWTHEMAYVLGFILTDGCVTGNTVSIAQAEKEPLEAIRGMMASDHPIRVEKNGINNLYVLNVHRRVLVDALARRGIGEKKSLTVGLPEVPTEFLSDFLRGVIDGDGWVHPKGYVVTITSGSKEFAEQLTARLQGAGFPFRTEHDGSAYRIKLSGKDEIKRLEAYLYHDPTAFCIARKRKRMAYHKLTAI